MEIEQNQYVCYIIKSTNINFINRTYVGSTNNINRRLKQHNRILKGGAKATGIGYPYTIHCLITGFTDKITALKCEWLLKHPNGKKYGNSNYGNLIGRIKALNYLFQHSDKWRNLIQNMDIKVYVNCVENYEDIIEIPYTNFQLLNLNI